MNTLVSVIIPIYNVECYVEQCLNSVINQTLSNIEIICVNDASTDCSYKIAKELSLSDMRIRLVNNSINQGLSYSRNCGLKIAKGKYIYFLDSDDYLDINALEILYRYAENNKTDIVYFDTKLLYESLSTERTTYRAEHIKSQGGILQGKELFVQQMQNNDFDVSVCRQFYSNAFLKKNHLCFEKGILHEDNLFSFLSCQKATRVMAVSEQLHNYRIRKNSTMTNSTCEHLWEKVISLSYIADMIYSNLLDYDDYGKESIISYVRMLCKQMMLTYSKIDYFDAIKIQTNVNKLKMLYLMTSCLYNGYFPYKLLKENMSRIRNSEKVIIYGAGDKGKGLYSLLSERNVNIDYFAVTKQEEAEFIDSVPVCQLNELMKYRENSIILIANVYHGEEMKQNALELGFNNILIL